MTDILVLREDADCSTMHTRFGRVKALEDLENDLTLIDDLKDLQRDTTEEASLRFFVYVETGEIYLDKDGNLRIVSWG